MIDNIKNYLIIGLVLALAGLGLWHWTEVKVLKHTITTQGNTITEQEGTIKSLKVNLKAAEDVNKELAKSVETQNGKIKEWEDASRKQKEDADKAIQKATAEREAWKNKFQSIWLSAPIDPKDVCRSLGVTIDEYLKARSEK